MALRPESRELRALDIKGVKRERVPLTVSKIQLPTTFKRYERRNEENINPADMKTNVPAPTCPDTDDLSRKPANTDPHCTLKKPKVSDSSMPRPGKKTLVKEKISSIYPDTFQASMTTLLDRKITGGKFEYASRIAQLTALNKDFKSAIELLLSKKNSLTTEWLADEAIREAELEGYKKTALEANTSKESLMKSLQTATTELESNKQELLALRAEKLTFTEQLNEVGEKKMQLEDTLQKTQLVVNQLQLEVADLNKTTEFKTQQLEKIREELAATSRQMAEEQVGARADKAQLEKSLRGQLEAAQQQQFETARSLEAVTKEKISLAEQVARFELEVLTAQNETLRARDQAAQAEKDCAGSRSLIQSLQDQLATRSVEMRTLFESLNKTQSIHEGRELQLGAELKEQKAKLEALTELKAQLEEEVRTVTSSFQDTSRRLEDTSSKLDTVTQELNVERGACEEAREIFRQTEARLAAEMTNAQTAWREQQVQLSGMVRVLTAERDEARQKAEQTHSELLNFQANSGVSNSEQLQLLCKTQMENQVLRQQLEGKDNLALSLVQSKEEIKVLKDRLFQGEATRRELHNKIQDMRGSIRVIVRVRPFLKHDTEQGPCAVEFNPNGQSLSLASEGNTHQFSFDQVFPTTSTQENVFDEVSNLVQSALDGFNVCLFSYGQTGSGKTHTMQGSLTGPNQGIIPRSIAKVMDEARRLGDQGWTYTFQATYLEIYNEQLRDLLGETRSSTNLDIKMDPNNLDSVYVPGLTKIPIKEAGEIEYVMNLATKHRAVAGTEMNEHSSRSHAVFTLFITGTNHDKGVVLEGSLNLCDLAGSERLSKSGAVGDRLKEAQAINKSLSSLGDVFQALQNRSSHIPYRNSKLTYLLSPCFSGQGKTLMFVNLSPLQSSHDESLCSLKFASKVTACELGNKTVKNVKKIAAPVSSSSSTSGTLKRVAPTPTVVRSRPGAR